MLNNAWQHRLHVFGNDVAAPVQQRPRARTSQQGERTARRESESEFLFMPTEMNETLYVVDQRVGCLHAIDLCLDLYQPLSVDDRRQMLQQLAPVAALQQFPFRVWLGVTDFDAHEEAIELRLWKRERAGLRARVLRRDHEERIRQCAR